MADSPTNGTPFSTSPLNSPFAQRGTGPNPGQGSLVDAFGHVVAPLDDPAWQPPRDPIATADRSAVAAVITREIPLVQSTTSWSPSDVRQALQSLTVGLFDLPSQLVDSVVGDSRVQSAMASRTGGLLGRPIKFGISPKYKDDDRAKRCLDEWQRAWPVMGSEPVLSEMLQWSVHLGFSIAQLLWDTSGDVWIPYVRNWHPRYSYYHWIFRRFIAIGLDGQTAVEPGDGHWVLHAPHGEYRGWMRGSVRALSPWWLARNYALRDWARNSERHGMPILLAKTPAAADPQQIMQYRAALAQMGQDTVIQLPQGVEEHFSYGLELLEAKTVAWEAFQQLIAQCNSEITLALLGQNLTSEVKEGSFAAARVHADVRQVIIEADARALSQTIYQQIARPFAKFNFGDPDLAPTIGWDVAAYEDNETMARTFVAFANGVSDLRKAGFKINDISAFARTFGLRMAIADIEETEPMLTSGGPTDAPRKAA